MLQTFKNAWRIPDLRKKMLFTIFIVVIYRLGAQIPVPYVNLDLLAKAFEGSGNFFAYINILSGDAFSHATLFALSVSPYITAQIIMQLLSIAIPALERISKDGEEGRRKINQITRYVTVGIGLVTALGYYLYLKNNNVINVPSGTPSGFVATVVVACYVAGSALIMWIAERINERGIGNGISVILFANILSSLPGFLVSLFQTMFNGTASGAIYAVVVIIVGLALLAFIVFMSESERRLPVQYAKKVVGRKMYGGQSTNLPIKINMSGVMPIIFANSILSLPSTIAALFAQPDPGSFWDNFLNFFSYQSWFYIVINVILIIAFSYFYIAISFNPVEVSNNLKKNGGFILGIRPGRPTADYIKKVLNKIILIGAIMLCVVAVLPLILSKFSASSTASLAFGGSSIIIVVGVALELARAVEAEMTMRHYKGFLE